MKASIKDKNGVQSIIDCFFFDNKHNISISNPESYPCIITWSKHDCDGYGGYYIDYEYVYLTDFEQ